MSFSNFFSRKKKTTEPTTGTDDNTTSEPSDEHLSQSSANLSDYSSPRRASILGTIASKFRKEPETPYELPGDSSIDDQMKALYLDVDELEQKCRFDPDKFNTKHGLASTLQGSSATDISVVPKHLSLRKTADTVIENLYEGFFTPTFDPVYLQLEQVSSWLDSADCDMNLRFMDAIEEADTDKDMIMSRLAALIETNKGAITESQNDIFSIDVDLARAATQISISRRKMGTVVELVAHGSIRLTRLQKKREKLKSVQDMLKNFKVLGSLYDSAVDLALNSDFAMAVKCAFHLIMTTKNALYEKFAVTESIRNKILKILPMIRIKADKALNLLSCRRFDPNQYGSIVKCYMIFDYMRDSMGIYLLEYRQRSASVSPKLSPVHIGGVVESQDIDCEECMGDIASRIVRYQIADVQQAMRATVIDCIVLGQQQRKRGTSSESADALNDSSMVDMDLEQLFKAITPDIAVNCVIRCCEMLTEVVHTHYLFSQWHRSPFDPQNADSDQSHLHRCQAILKEEESLLDSFSDDEDDENDESTGRGRNSSVNDTLRDRFGSIELEPPSDIDRAVADGLEDSKDSPNEGNDYEDGVTSKENTDETSTTTAATRDPVVDDGAVSDSVSIVPTSPSESSSSRPRSLSSHGNHRRHSLSHKPNDGKEFKVSLDNLKEDILGDIAQPILMQSTRLKLTYAQLIDSRVHIWDEIEGSLWLLLKTVPLASSISIESFLMMSWTLNTMVDLGREFCRAKSRALISCIEERSSKYFEEVHKDSFLMLRQVIDAEPWRNIPIDIDEHGGILGLIKLNLSRSQVASAAKQKIRVRGIPSTKTDATDDLEQNFFILSSFASHGNPFTLLSEDSEATSVSSSSNATTNVIDVLFGEEAPIGSATKKKHATAAVVTQSCLNGLVQLVGKYSQTMYIVKSASSDMFTHLCQLFDFYVCSVFNGFVSAEQRQRLLSSTKENAPPPDAAKDFEVLYSYTLRVCDCPVPGQTDKNISQIFGTPNVLMDHSDVNIDSPIASSIGGKNALDEHLVAAESCWFAANVMKEMKPKLFRLLPESSHIECSRYIDELQKVVGQLQALVYRGICPQLCLSNSLAARIVDVQWDSKKQGDAPNAWVELLVSNCREVWGYLNENNEFALVHELAREQTWMELCQAAYDIVLDTFSKSKKNNALGSTTTSSDACRQGIIIDLAALQSSLDGVHSCRPARGKEYVEEYVRATGLSDDDMMHWTLASVMKKTKQKECLVELDGLYDQEQTFKEGPKKRRSILGFATGRP